MTTDAEIRRYFRRRYGITLGDETTQPADVISFGLMTATCTLDVQASAAPSAYGEMTSTCTLDTQCSAAQSAIADMTATCTLDIQISGALSGDADMTATCTLDVQCSADLTAYGNMTATCTLDTQVAADLTSVPVVGEMTATCTLDTQVAADLTAYGEMSATCNLDVQCSADLESYGNMTSTCTVDVQISAAQSAIADMTATCNLDVQSSSALSAYGNMTATCTLDTQIAAALIGYGNMTATCTLDTQIAADLTAPSGPTVWYAKPTATGTESGTSWANADTLDGALASASSGEEVWCIEGTYSLKLTVKDGVVIRGGFDSASPESSAASRDLENNISILDGGDSDVLFNTYSSSTGSLTFEMEAFTLQNGFTDTFDNYPDLSGVMCIDHDSASNTVIVKFNRCRIFDNTGLVACSLSILNGAAGTARFVLENCIVDGGTPSDEWQIWTEDTGCELEVINCVLTDPTGTAPDEILTADGASTQTIVNSILWLINDGTGPVIDDATTSGPGIVATYSDIDGGYTGTGNINSDPLWTDESTRDFTLTGSSPCIDAGDGDEAPTLDMWLQARYDDGGTGAGTPDYTDMGPLEYQGT